MHQTHKRCAKKIKVKELSVDIAYAARDDTRLGGLIEFSRSIHAEMDAIVSLAFKEVVVQKAQPCLPTHFLAITVLDIS